jgi:hypothetical protein
LGGGSLLPIHCFYLTIPSLARRQLEAIGRDRLDNGLAQPLNTYKRIDVAKGSHKNPITPHQDSFDELNLLLRGQSRQKYGVLATRKLSLHHRLMIHCYGPNISDGHRIDVVIRYISPHTQSLITRAAMASPCAVNVTQEISISAHHQRACSTQIILYSMRKFETVKQRS